MERLYLNKKIDKKAKATLSQVAFKKRVYDKNGKKNSFSQMREESRIIILTIR